MALSGCSSEGEPPAAQSLISAETKLLIGCLGACDAVAEPGCEKSDIAECNKECAVLVRELAGFCGEEHSALFNCLAGTEYACVDGASQPVEGPIPCYPYTLSTYGCLVGLTCKKYCRAAQEAGCGADTCIKECEQGRPVSPDCDEPYGALRACQIEKMACEGGSPVPVGCDAEQAALAACDAP